LARFDGVRAGVRRLILPLAVFLAAWTAPAAATDYERSVQDCRVSATEWLAVHRGSDSLIFPRDGVAAQPAIESRKKNFKQPVDRSIDDADLTVQRAAATDARFGRAVLLHAALPVNRSPYSWHSRAPPR